ncbi:Protein DA1-related 2 [Dendrobium catenatum]|uniref:Protein DA1-related 2 n=1 Tax=Dendrobium catenatum TaxID=906689 RepID=A0A2I0WN86_9ASPA|nr:Protein DA1-related 2 [Dendrobium catenatum]
MESPYNQRKSGFMKWFSKLFKGSSRGTTYGRRPEVVGEENMFWRGPSRPLVDCSPILVDDRSRAENEDLDHAIALSLAERAKKRNGHRGRGNDDEDFSRAIDESLGGMPSFCPYNPNPIQFLPRGFRLCGGCKHEIGYGHYLSCMGTFWHPHCFRCYSCGQQISETEIPTNLAGLIEYRAHPFWGQKYCPSHEHDSTPRCCSCERMEIPMLLVERQALNDAMEGEKDILKKPRIGKNRILDMRTYPQKLIRRCEVTAILVLYGLPSLLNLLAGDQGLISLDVVVLYIGYRNLSPEVEEGICQVLSHMWLESEVMAGPCIPPPSSNYASSSSSSSATYKKGGKSEIEKKLGEFFMHQIAHDISPAYGEGFRMAHAAVNRYNLVIDYKDEKKKKKKKKKLS